VHSLWNLPTNFILSCGDASVLFDCKTRENTEGAYAPALQSKKPQLLFWTRYAFKDDLSFSLIIYDCIYRWNFVVIYIGEFTFLWSCFR
jgi:hypothetical protein